MYKVLERLLVTLRSMKLVSRFTVRIIIIRVYFVGTNLEDMCNPVVLSSVFYQFKVILCNILYCCV